MRGGSEHAALHAPDLSRRPRPRRQPLLAEAQGKGEVARRVGERAGEKVGEKLGERVGEKVGERVGERIGS